MCSTFAPSLTTAVIFRRIGSHDRYRKRGLNLPIGEKKLVKVQGCSHKRNARSTHFVARILQHGGKFSSRLKVNKISNQTVHHQSATKFESMLPDIKKISRL